MMDSSQRFFAQTGRMTFDDLQQGRLMRPQLTYGVSEDMPEMFLTKHSVIRRDFSRSPDRTEIKPTFAYNEYAFYGDKEIYDFSSVMPTSTFDMRNTYRLDLTINSPYFKQYHKTLKSDGFARKEGMCSVLAGLCTISRSPPPRGRKPKACKTVSPTPPKCGSARRKPTRPLAVSYEAKRAVRLTEEARRALASEIADTQTSISTFEQSLRH
jgi:hypothetical protein